MLNILVCCGGGMSSGILAKKLQKEIDTLGLNERVHAEFVNFHNSWRIIDKFDIVMCCPHQRYEIPKMMKEHGDVIHIPLTIVAPMIYGTFRAEDIIEDAVDLIEIYKTNPTNPCHFPDEDSSVSIRRTYSHRKSIDKIPNNIDEALKRFEEIKKIKAI